MIIKIPRAWAEKMTGPVTGKSRPVRIDYLPFTITGNTVN